MIFLLCFASGLGRWQTQRPALKALPHPTCCQMESLYVEDLVRRKSRVCVPPWGQGFQEGMISLSLSLALSLARPL